MKINYTNITRHLQGEVRRALIMELYNSGYRSIDIQKMLGVSRKTVYRARFGKDDVSKWKPN